jgi:hypothetical protein
MCREGYMFQKQVSFHLTVVLVLGMTVAGCMAASNSRVINRPCVAGDKNDSACNIVQGYSRNDVSPNAIGVTIGGGGDLDLPNHVTGDYGTVGGGLDNSAGDRAIVAGGSHNIANGLRAVVGGGSSNTASGAYSTLGGGENNISNYYYTTVGGGNNNTASGRLATVGGGSGNIASFTLATVSGGAYNTASGLAATVGGGSRSRAGGTYATISGGSGNVADSLDAVIGGGSGNIVTGDEGTIGGGLVNRVTDKYSTIGGGKGNLAGNLDDDPTNAQYSTVGGGMENKAQGLAATVSGGTSNIASGSFSAIPGGSSNQAAAAYSVAAGRHANVRATHDGAFLYADSNDVEFDSQATNEFAIRATGGVRFITAIDPTGNPSAGVRLVGGSGSWESLSDRNAKTGLAPVDGLSILKRVASLPITTWSYKTQSPSIQHIGPMAQDFYAAFGIGDDNKYISSVDADGVALAAIQGLDQMMRDKDAQIEAQQKRIEAMESEIVVQRSQLAALEARMATMEQAMEARGYPSQPPSASLPAGWLTLGTVGVLGLALAQWRHAGN